MQELVFGVRKQDAFFVDYIYKKLAEPVRSVGGLCALVEIRDQKKLGVAVCDECFNAINKVAKMAVAEVLAIGYKNRYLRDKININTDNLLSRILLDTMCIFDSNYDANLIRKNIHKMNIINLDGCYNFRLSELKSKWDEIVALSNNYSVYFSEKSVVYEFLNFLLDAIPCLCDTITVVVNEDFTKYELLNAGNIVLRKFETFCIDVDIYEDILFNLICYNPNVVNFCGNFSEYPDEFMEIANGLFSVREFLPENK